MAANFKKGLKQKCSELASFLRIKSIFKCLNVLRRIFFVSEDFGNFQVLFSTFICKLIDFQTQFSNPVEFYSTFFLR